MDNDLWERITDNNGFYYYDSTDNTIKKAHLFVIKELHQEQEQKVPVNLREFYGMRFILRDMYKDDENNYQYEGLPSSQDFLYTDFDLAIEEDEFDGINSKLWSINKATGQITQIPIFFVSNIDNKKTKYLLENGFGDLLIQGSKGASSEARPESPVSSEVSKSSDSPQNTHTCPWTKTRR